MTLALVSSLATCKKWCDPDKIMNGESNQHHDSKKMRAIIIKIRPHEAWARLSRVTYHTTFECQPEFKVGDTVDCTGWDKREYSLTK